MMSKKYLFSETEEHYRSLGLRDIDGVIYHFNGMKDYSSVNPLDYACFICSYYSLSQNTLLTIRFRKLGVPTILVSDGIYDFANSFSNQMHAKYELIFYHNIIQDSLIMADKKSCKYLKFSGAKNIFHYRPNRMISNKNLVRFSCDKSILITTANQAYFNNKERERLIEFLVGVVSILKERNVRFRFRIFDKELLDKLSLILNEIDNDISSNFEDCLYKYSHVITTPSSITLTSMFHEKPVMSINIRTEPLNIQSGWVVSNIELFQDSLDEFLDNYETRLIQQRYLLNDYLSDNDLMSSINDAIKGNLRDDVIFCDKMLLKMLNSKFNFNFEYFIRRIYYHVKKYNLVKYLRKAIKW